MHILYAIGSWGLGHATRSLPVVRALLARGHDVTVVSHGRALLLLRRELPRDLEFLDWPHVPHTLARTPLGFYLRSAAAIPAMLRIMHAERIWTQELLRHRRVDRLVADNRYGVQDPSVPSFHITNSVRFIAPGRVRFIEDLLERFNYQWFRGLRCVIVPDTVEDALAGELAHGLRVFPSELLAYVGIVSHVRARPVEQDLDLFVSISGPEPQRTLLEQAVRRQLPGFGGKVVVTLGRPEAPGKERIGSAEVYGFLDGAAQEEMLNRARVVAARPGYSTLCALAEIGTRALLIPTPGQTEQVYLGAYHHGRGSVWSVPQSALHLAAGAGAAAARPGLRARTRTDQAVARIVTLITAG